MVGIVRFYENKSTLKETKNITITYLKMIKIKAILSKKFLYKIHTILS